MQYNAGRRPRLPSRFCFCVTVIPAKAGIHFDLCTESKMDSGFRRNDGAGDVRIAMNTLAEITRSLDDIAAADSLESLDALRVALLGKNGAITAALKSLGALPPDERKARGAEVNRAKESIADAIAARKATLEQASLDRRLASERIDITLPGRRAERLQRGGDRAVLAEQRDAQRVERFERGGGGDVFERAGDFGECGHWTISSFPRKREPSDIPGAEGAGSPLSRGRR